MGREGWEGRLGRKIWMEYAGNTKYHIVHVPIGSIYTSCGNLLWREYGWKDGNGRNGRNMDAMDSSMEDSENREDQREDSSIKNGEMEGISEGIPSTLPSTKTGGTQEKPEREEIPPGTNTNREER